MIYDIPLLPPEGDTKLENKSSISQFSRLFSALVGGEWVPIMFDEIEYVECADPCKDTYRVKSHRAALTDGDDSQFTYPVGTCHYWNDEYVLTDVQETVVKELPSYFGSGTYEKFEKYKTFTNGDNGSAGLRNKLTYRIGLNYWTAKNSLDAIK